MNSINYNHLIIGRIRLLFFLSKIVSSETSPLLLNLFLPEDLIDYHLEYT